MIRIFDSVRLVKDFDNGPGIIKKGTRGTVVALAELSGIPTAFVVWKDVSNLDSHGQYFNKTAGLPMYYNEIEKV